MFAHIRNLFRQPVNAAPQSPPATVGEVVTEYLSSARFRALSPVSQSVYRATLTRWVRTNGVSERPITSLSRREIESHLAPLTQGAANHTFKRVRVLVRFAVARGYLNTDPTTGIVSRPINRGWHTWADCEIAQYRDHHRLGSRERLAFELALGTAQRRTDLARMRWADIRDRRLVVTQQKTKATLSIPIDPDLAAALDRVRGSRTGTILCRTARPRGRPLTPEALGTLFARWIEEAGLPDACVLHGLRKAACRQLAEAGCSEKEIAAISGHRTLAEVARYTQAASQLLLSDRAMARLEGSRRSGGE